MEPICAPIGLPRLAFFTLSDHGRWQSSLCVSSAVPMSFVPIGLTDAKI